MPKRNRFNSPLGVELMTAKIGRRWIVFRDGVPVDRRKNRELAQRRILCLWRKFERNRKDKA